jgi:glycosyltransferase involved in cell wall biosynthesis
VIRCEQLRILYVINNAAFFVSHRLPIALAARQRGDDVALVTGKAGSETMERPALDELQRLGLEHTVLPFTSAGTNPVIELSSLWQLVMTMRRVRPMIVHCASPKGLLLGGLAARLARVPGLVLAVSGQGYTLTGNSRDRALLRWVYRTIASQAYRHRNRRVIVQNKDDEAATIASGFAHERDVVVIPGSGVELDRYVGMPIEGRERLVILPARMLRDKGVREFVEAAAQLKRENAKWTFALVGTADYANPTAISESQLREWERSGAIEWWGHRSDMLEVYRRAQIVCLPSYREGMPKVLLEAAAAGCAVVTTDAVGCREAVVQGETGELVPVGDSSALAAALRRLIAEPDRVRLYGMAGRRLAIERFGLDAVVRRILAIYDELGSHVSG